MTSPGTEQAVCDCNVAACPVPVPIEENGIRYFAVVGAHCICPHRQRCECGSFDRDGIDRTMRWAATERRKRGE